MHELSHFSGISWGVNYVSTARNLGYALATAELAQRFGATAINIIRFIPIGRGRHNRRELWVESEAYRAEVASLASRYRLAGQYFEDCAIFELQSGSNLRYLFAGNESPFGVSVLHDGRTFFTPAGLALGNAREQGLNVLLERLWRDPVVNERYEHWVQEDHREIVNNSGERK
jgi:MoaA/NifB/PqqE/SkfB family radical SAM enzyme